MACCGKRKLSIPTPKTSASKTSSAGSTVKAASSLSRTWRGGKNVCKSCGGSLKPNVIMDTATKKVKQVNWACIKCGLKM